MRTDVKLGVVISLAIVLVAGGYYVYRDQQHDPIPITTDRGGARHTAKPARPSGRVAQTTKRGPHAAGAGRHAPKPKPGSSPATGGTGADTRGARAGQSQQQRVAAAGRPKRTPSQGTRKAGTTPAQRRRRTGETAKRQDPSSSRRVATLSPRPAAATPMSTKQAANERVADRAGDVAPDRGDHGRTSGQLDKKAPARGSPTRPSELPRAQDPGRTRQGRTLIAARKAPKGKPATARVATPRKTAPPGAAVDIHRVQPGDTFSSLAAMYYGDVKYTQFLVDRNAAVGDPKRLAVGTEIRIPALPVSTDAPAGANPVVKAASKTPQDRKGKTYTVKSGDTFYAIARDALGNAARWRELLELNTRIVKGDPTRLQVGQVILLPD